MKSPDGKTLSAWWDGVNMPSYPPVPGDLDADVCVVGAGISGLTVAYELAARGKKVVVVDAGPVGDGQTGRTSAHLASALDDRFVNLEKAFGQDGSRLAYQSHAAAIDEIERIASAEHIDCEFARVDAYLFLGPDQKPSFIDDELHAAQRAGFTSAARLDRAPLPNTDTGPCIHFPKQAQFHPLKYLAGLARACEKKGVRIFCGNRVIEVQGTDEKKHEKAHAKTQDGRTIRADAIVVATNTPAPINDWLGIYLKQVAYRTYVVALPIAKGAIPTALYWDTADPYHYDRIDAGATADATTGATSNAGHDLLLVGGADHRTGQFPEHGGRFVELMDWAKKRFPVSGEAAFNWSGQVQEPADGLGYIGRAPTSKPDVYVITGDSGMGLTHGTIGGLLIPDLIEGKSNPWETIYDPSRKPTGALHALETFAAANTATVAKYTQYLSGGDVKSADDIPPGSGAIVREGLHKLAMYKTRDGDVHRCSAVCTHLGCIVQWNPVEETWDCPCHGARYDPMGKVVLGPAIEDLKAAT